MTDDTSGGGMTREQLLAMAERAMRECHENYCVAQFWTGEKHVRGLAAASQWAAIVTAAHMHAATLPEVPRP